MRARATSSDPAMNILYAMAAEAEYGPHLRAKISPLMTGVGPVEAAIAMTAALARSVPDYVVSLGSAGSSRLEQTGIYQALSVSYRDMDASPLGFEKGVTPFLDLPAVLPLDPPIEGIEPASLSTGADIVSGPAYGLIDADMVDMETYALARACQRFEVPLIAVRGISDGASELTGAITDWTHYLEVVDLKLARAVDLIEAQLQGRA